jgi:hypothetical protein
MNVRETFAHLLRYIVLILAGSSVALAGTRDPNTPDEKYVEFGKQFPNVVRIRALTTIKDKKSGVEITLHQYGSAVLIRPNWALTAAHVLHDTREPEIMLADDKKHAVPYFVIHHDFKDESFGHGDLALCYSDKDFEAEFYPELYRDTDELGKAVTIAGYGFAGTFHTGAQTADNKRRGGHNAVEGTERGVLICRADVKNRYPLEFLITPGDSGGGMFIGNKLAGINSFLMAADKQPNGSYGDEAAHTRISLYADWIESQITAHELRIAGKGTTASDLNLVFPADK